MAVADTLPDTIATTASALGLLDAEGNLDPRFFDAPLTNVGRALTDPARRRVLLDALPVLVGEGEVEPHETGERRRYLLFEQEEGDLALSVDLDGPQASSDLTLLVTVRARIASAST